MTKKLGEILVAGKLLDPMDLKKALDAQLMFGGRLGTNLLELGYLSESQLADALRDQSKVKVATLEMLETADAGARRLIPASVATKHSVIPLAHSKGKLEVAMVDPTDLIALDEIAFVSGCKITHAFVVPEVRIVHFLEEFYDVPRPVRYLKLAQTVKGEGGTVYSDEEALNVSISSGLLELDEDKILEESNTAVAPRVKARSKDLDELPTVSDRVLTIKETLGVAPGTPLTVEDIKCADQVAPAQREKMDAALGELAQHRETTRKAADEERFAKASDMQGVAALLAEAETREDIGQALLAFASNHFSRVMCYIVQRDRALGWVARMPGASVDQSRQTARRLIVPLGEASVIQGVATTGQYYMGELPSRAADEVIAAVMGGERPNQILVLPVKLSEKVVIALQGDNPGKPLGEFDMRSLRLACQKAALAMEVLLLRSKIRQVLQ